MICGYCTSSRMSQSRGQTVTCENCGLVHDHKHQPIGWAIMIAGRSGGLIPFKHITSVLPQGDAAEIAELLYETILQGFNDRHVHSRSHDLEALHGESIKH